jgi:hypothetical protein
MPLVALVDGQRKVSSLLSDDEWSTLQKFVRAKKGSLTLLCGLPGHAKTRKGTRFFAHNPGTGGACTEHPGETAQHLRAKDIIVRAAVAAGWDAQPEVVGDGWVADVLAEKDGKKVAFEVQWSPQGDVDYASRQERYAASGVRCAWFVRHERSVHVPTKEVPIFLLAENGDGMTVSLGSETQPLADGVTALLEGRLQHRDYVSSGDPAEMTVHLHQDQCWKCSAPFMFWTVSGTTATGPCGLTHCEEGHYGLFAKDRIEATPEIRQAAKQAAIGATVPLAKLSPRSTKASGTTYMAFSCPKCGAVSGDMFIRDMLMEKGYEEPLRKVSLPVGEHGLPHPHWCLDTGAGNCATPPTGYTPPQLPETTEPIETAALATVRSMSVQEGIRMMFRGSYY